MRFIRRAMNSLSYKQYVQYFILGSFVGILTVIVRHVIAKILPLDTPIYYLLSIIFAYGFGVVVNFLVQRTYTFKSNQGAPAKKILIIPFTIIAVMGSLLTMSLSSLFRYKLGFDFIFGNFSGTIAFILASFMGSIFNYLLNAKLVFKNGELCDTD